MQDILIFASEQWLLITSIFALIALLIFHESRKGGPTLSPAEVIGLINRQKCSVIDLRPEKEFKLGHITGAKSIPLSKLDKHIGELQALSSAPLVLVCAIGQHSGSAGRRLKAAGLETVFRLGGGMLEWQRQQLPLVRQ